MTDRSLRGYCRTLMLRIAWYPAIKIIRLTTVATTGRLINRSVKLISSSRRSTVCRVRRQVAARLNLVIDLDGCAALEPEHARCDNFVTRLKPGDHRNHIAACLPSLDKLFLNALVFFALRVFQLGDHKNGIAIRRVMNGGGGNRHHILPFAQDDTHFGKHPGTKPEIRVCER